DHSNKPSLVVKFSEVLAPDIAHGCAQPAAQLMHNIGDRPLIWHLPLNAFGNELERIFDLLLEVAIGGTARHRADRTHAAIGLVGAALIEKHLPGCLVGAGEQ